MEACGQSASARCRDFRWVDTGQRKHAHRGVAECIDQTFLNSLPRLPSPARWCVPSLPRSAAFERRPCERDRDPDPT